MINHIDINDPDLYKKIKRSEILFGGNRKLKIYGRLHCASGKRMSINNRVFFVSEKEAINNGYRPCGNCMKEVYKQWKDALV